ncbi:hypothetical protein HK57_00395 [Aspergillus ustus]|uniref:FAD-binding PCMH-type domain-containing protein n=1 Tax=Aspergillus ustus TaxID=40382 RepID=A0A0C1BW68_ASPUT|nr:hypothetical protein HK57_00395 [Aspergillus ustus]
MGCGVTQWPDCKLILSVAWYSDLVPVNVLVDPGVVLKGTMAWATNITAMAWASMLWTSLPDFRTAFSRTSAVNLRSILNDPSHGWSANTSVLFPESSDFEAATERWTAYSSPTYSAAIRPGTEADIVKTVQLARMHNIPFLTRGAGHGYSVTLAEFQDGVALDLSLWKSIQIDAAAETLTIGPGVTINDVLDPLYEAGFQIQTGTCSCPSLIGVTLGGGAGRYQGIHGLVLDALVSVRIVTAKSEVLEVSRDSHPDLFWAIRGAGANFGIVVSATYKVHRLVNGGQFLHADFYFPAERSMDYFQLIEAYDEYLPANLATIVVINYNTSTNQVQIGGNWVYFGPEEQGLKLLAPILALNPTASAVNMVPYNKILETTGGNYDRLVCQPSVTRDLYSLNQKKYSAVAWQQAFERMSDFYTEHPAGRNSALVFEVFPNQATAAVADGETAYAWRDARGYIIAHFVYEEGDAETAAVGNKLGLELRSQLALTSGYDEPSVFVNYARGDEGLERIYGREKLGRLAALKRIWDPENMFRFGLGIPVDCENV